MRHLLMERLTDSGRAVFYLLLLSQMVGGASFVVKIYLVTCGLFGLAVTSIFAAAGARRRCKVQWNSPDRVTCGQPFEIQFEVENPSARWRALDVNILPIPLDRNLRLIDPQGNYLGTLQPGQRRTGKLELLPSRRGHYLLKGIRQATVFPFGLWRSWHDHKAQRALLVYPTFKPLSKLDIEVGRRYQPGGIALTSHLGDSTEFLSTREFRYGDSLRSIHWRSWARTGKPIVKEFQEEFFCRIALVVDTFMGAKQVKARREEFEAAISLAASVADSLSREEYVIDIFAAGPELYQLQAGRSLAHFENVMDILACVQPCHEAPFEKLEPVFLESLENITTAVVVLLDWDERRQRFLQAIQERGCGIKAVLVKNKLSPEQAAQIEGDAGRFSWVTAEQIRQGLDQL
jgi:uncharacterized protein (DUF58 family)